MNEFTPGQSVNAPKRPEEGSRPPAKFNFSKFETPLVLRHVESHLIFGPLARRFSAAWLALALLSAIFIVLISTGQSATDEMSGLSALAIGFGYLGVLTQATLRQQATFLWAITKFVLAFVCIVSLPMAFCLWLGNGRTDLRPVALLSVIWVPLPEFIPRVTPHQRYLTLGRLLLSIPFVIDIITNPQNTWS